MKWPKRSPSPRRASADEHSAGPRRARSATKAAIHNLTRSLAFTLADRGIRVNCVAPGPVWTPLIPATRAPGQVSEHGAGSLWKRPAQPAELAPTYVFLACDGRGERFSQKIWDFGRHSLAERWRAGYAAGRRLLARMGERDAPTAGALEIHRLVVPNALGMPD